MEYRRLGKSGLKVSALSLGSWLTFGKRISDDVAKSLMIEAYEQGVNFFDNAEIYAQGQSEIVMGNILKDLNWDKKAFMKGRVVNKLARYNLCFADFKQEPDYDEGKGRVYDFKDLKELQKIIKDKKYYFSR